MGFEDLAHHLHRAALVKQEATATPSEDEVELFDDVTASDDGDVSGAPIAFDPSVPPEVVERWKTRLEKAMKVVGDETPMQTLARVSYALSPEGEHHAVVSGYENGRTHIEALGVDAALELAMSLHFASVALNRMVPAVLSTVRDKLAEGAGESEGKH